MKNATQLSNICQNNRCLHISHRPTTSHKTPNPCTPASFVSNPKCLQSLFVHCGFRNKSPLKPLPPKAWVTRRLRPRWACRSRRRSAGCRGCARTATRCRTTPGDTVAKKLVCVSHLSAPLLHDTHVLKCPLYSPQCFKPVSHGFFCRTISRVSIALVHQISFTIQLLQVHQICRHFPPTCITERGQAAIGCSRKWIPRLRIVPLKETQRQTSLTRIRHSMAPSKTQTTTPQTHTQHTFVPKVSHLILQSAQWPCCYARMVGVSVGSALNTSQGADLDTNSLPQIVRVPIKNQSVN